MELYSVESSDDCAHGGDMSSSRSLRPWPRFSTTPHEDRRRRGPGRRISSCTARRCSGRILLPRRQAQSTLPWMSMMCLPPWVPGLTGSRRSGRRSGYSGAPCSRSSTTPFCRGGGERDEVHGQVLDDSSSPAGALQSVR